MGLWAIRMQMALYMYGSISSLASEMIVITDGNEDVNGSRGVHRDGSFH